MIAKNIYITRSDWIDFDFHRNEYACAGQKCENIELVLKSIHGYDNGHVQLC